MFERLKINIIIYIMCLKTTYNIYAFITTIFSICCNKPKENYTKKQDKSNDIESGFRVHKPPYLRYQVYGDEHV